MTPLEFILIPLITGAPASLSLSGKLLSSLWSESAPQFSPERPSCCPSCWWAFPYRLLIEDSVQDKTGSPACSVGHSSRIGHRPSLFLPFFILPPLSTLPRLSPSKCPSAAGCGRFPFLRGIGQRQYLAHLNVHILLSAAVSQVLNFPLRCSCLLLRAYLHCHSASLLAGVDCCFESYISMYAVNYFQLPTITKIGASSCFLTSLCM